MKITIDPCELDEAVMDVKTSSRPSAAERRQLANDQLRSLLNCLSSAPPEYRDAVLSVLFRTTGQLALYLKLNLKLRQRTRQL